MTEIYWLNPINGSFTNATLWSGGVVPGASDDALLDAAGPTRFIVASSVDETVESLQLAANATLRINGGTFDSPDGTGAGANWGTIAVGDGATFSVGGALANGGTITLDSLGDETSLVIASDTTLSGGGAVSLSDSASNQIAATPGASVTLTNVDNTLLASAAIGAAGGLDLDNQAFGIIASSGSRNALTIGPATGSEALTNDGLIEAADANVFIRNMAVTGSGGTIFAGYLEEVEFTDCTVGGQTLKVSANGQIYFARGSSVSLGGVFDSAGTLVVDSSSTLVLDGSLTFEGGGYVQLGQITSSAPKAILTNVSDRIYLLGNLGGPGVGLVNKAGGTIISSAPSAMVDTGERPVTNAGLIEAETGGGLTVAGDIRNTGTLLVNLGTMTIGGDVTGRGAATIAGGTLDFAAASDQDVTFDYTPGVTAKLVLGQSLDYTGTVRGFSDNTGESLDLRDIGFVGSGEATYSGSGRSGILTVSDGTHTATINLYGNYLKRSFIAAPDGSGGVSITVIEARDAPAGPHALIAAMAALGPPAAHATPIAEGWTASSPTLAGPRVASV